MMEILADGAQELGLDISETQLQQFQRYYEVLTDWAQRVSLTAVRDSEGIQRRHFLESAAILPVLAQEGLSLEDKSLVDVGSGTGVPGIPLKILVPSLTLTVVEAKHRKVEFLEALLSDLGMSEVTVMARRAEESGRDPRHRDQYDFAVAKALAPLRTLLELTLPFLRMGGVVIAPKGKETEAEVQDARVALEMLKGALRAVEPLPLSEPPQHLILVDKELPTPLRFPRRPGVPAKRPL
ncbi:MAG: 16S rRNA (guanine(527)-N(7))-methyltransferase RsmG [Dehalococcoidia bacterium]